MTARIILKYTANRDLVPTLTQFFNELVSEAKENSVELGKADVREVVGSFLKKHNAKPDEGDVQGKGPLDLDANKRNNSHFLFGFFIDSFALSIANGVIIMFQSLDLFNGFILLFAGITMSVFGFAFIFTSRLSGATFLAFMIIFILFIPEMFFFVTSSFYWFRVIIITITVALLIIVVTAIAVEEQKKRKYNKQSSKE